MPHHREILHDLKLLNSSFVYVLDYMIAFKPEIGLSLQRMIEAYNLLLIDQFTGYYSNQEGAALEQQRRGERQDAQERALAQAKTELYAQ